MIRITKRGWISIIIYFWICIIGLFLFQSFYRIHPKVIKVFKLIQLPPTDTNIYPLWSPTKDKIAFISNRSGKSEIWIMDSNGKHQKQLTNITADSIFYFSFSPNGKDIIMNGRIKKKFYIWQVNINTKKQRQLTQDGVFCIYPRFSPNGSKIAFSIKNNEIWIMNSDGSNQQRLINNTGDWFFDWSPDGKKIIYTKKINNKLGICLIDVNGSNKIQLTNNEKGTICPRWSPDGNKIAFLAERIGKRGIWVMNPDGYNQKCLSSNGNSPEFVWSPDGKKIAYEVWRNGISHIWVMNTDGSNSIRLTPKGLIATLFPTWSPDGKRIAFCGYGKDLKGFNSSVWVAMLEE